MFDGLIEAIVDFFRTVLWSVVEVFLFIVDMLWEIVLRIATLNVADITDINNWFLLISATVVLFIIFKLFKMFIKFYVDEEYREKLNISKTLVMLSLVSVLVAAIPMGYGYVCYISSNAIENMNVFIPGETKDLKISNILIQSGRVNMKDTSADLGKEIEMNSDFDINAKDDDGNYLYFPEFSNIFLMIIVSIVCFFIFAMTALQIAQRLSLIILKYLMSPYVVSTIIDPEDNTFGTWMKMLSGDLIMNFMQIYGVYLAMFLCVNVKISELLGGDAIGVFAKIVFFIGCLMGVQELPTVVASLTGGSGKAIMQSLQDLKSTVGVGKAVAGGAKSIATGTIAGGIAAAGSVANGAHTAKEAAMQGYSRGSNPVSGAAYATAGVVTAAVKATTASAKNKVSSVGKNASSIYQGGIGGLRQNRKNANAQSTNTSKTSQAFNDPPTERQLYAAEKLGIDNPGSMSKGELSLALEKAGADTSYWADHSGPSSGSSMETISQTSDSLMKDAAKYYGIDTTGLSTDEVKQSLKSKGYKMADTSTKTPKSVSSGGNGMYQTNLSNKTLKHKGGLKK